MAQQPLDHLQILPKPAQLRGRGVAQIVKASALQAGRLDRVGEIRPQPTKASKLMRHRSFADRWAPELQWRAIDSRAVPIPIDQRNAVISDAYVFGPTLNNEARLGFNRRRFSRTPSTLDQDWAKQLGIPNGSCQDFCVNAVSG
jgi:hypothetical protein